MNHKEELNLLKEQIALLNVTENEDILEKINKTVERMEFSPLFKPYGLFFEDYKENEVEILNTHKLIPTQLDDLLIEKDLNKPVNLLLEGDNYQALKLLEKTHKEKIDVIYIDPPYNTGNKDFVYNDAYVNNEDAFRHSKWLSFMDKRLKIAKKLLNQKGVIFISIDDNEQSQLKLLCDTVFGEQNFISTSIWHSNKSVLKQSKTIRKDHEYVLVYAKNYNQVSFNRLENSMEFTNPDKDPKGPWFSSNATLKTDKSHANYFGIDLPNGDLCYRRWKFSEKDFNADKIDLYFKEGNVPRLKIYESDYDKNTGVPSSIISDKGSSTSGINEVTNVFGAETFSYPKPKNLISHFINLHPNKNATVLDFFAGSGTTGHAVMELNKEDGGKRQFILATNNEVSPDKELQLLISKGLVPNTPEVKKGQPFKEWKQVVSDFKETESYQEFIKSDDYNNLGIARQVTYERLKRVINGYTTPKGKVVEGLPNNLKHIFLDTVTNLDAKKGIYSQKDVVFFIENVMEDLDNEYFKGESKDKVVYVVGDEEEIDNLLSDFKNNTTDKEVIIYTNIVLINQFKHLEAGFTFKKFPKL